MARMLQRCTAPNGVVYYASPLLEAVGVPHAFSTRIGGLSRTPFDSLNLGNPNGAPAQDDYANVWANYRLLQDACGCGGRELLRAHQVHGKGVAIAEAGRPFDLAIKADALVSQDAARVVSVRVADCVPVLIASDDGQTVAAVHAGWRGVVAGVIGAAIAAMGQVAGRCPPPRLIVAIGPSISLERFEVGPEVLAEFVRVFGPNAPIRRRDDGKGHADLREGLLRQALDAGVPADRIDTTDRCTFRDREEFFSHRRDRGITGRMAGIISPGASPRRT
jgi:YfiH family protein